MQQVDGIGSAAGNIQIDRRGGIRKRICADERGIQRFDIRIGGRGKLIGFGKKEFIGTGRNALECGDLFKANIREHRASVRKQHVKRTAVPGEIADAEMRCPRGVGTAIIGDFQQIQSAGAVDDGDGEPSARFKGKCLLEVYVAVRAGDGHGLVAGGHAAIRRNRRETEQACRTAIADKRPETGIAISGIQKPDGGVRKRRRGRQGLNRIAGVRIGDNGRWRAVVIDRPAFAGVGKGNDGRLCAVVIDGPALAGVREGDRGELCLVIIDGPALAGVRERDRGELRLVIIDGPTLAGVWQRGNGGIRNDSIFFHMVLAEKKLRRPPFIGILYRIPGKGTACGYSASMNQ